MTKNREKRRAKRAKRAERREQEKSAPPKVSPPVERAKATGLTQDPPPGDLPHIFIHFSEEGYLEYLRGGPQITFPPSKYWEHIYIEPHPITSQVRILKDLLKGGAPFEEVDAHLREMGIRVGFEVVEGVDLGSYDLVVHGPG